MPTQALPLYPCKRLGLWVTPLPFMCLAPVPESGSGFQPSADVSSLALHFGYLLLLPFDPRRLLTVNLAIKGNSDLRELGGPLPGANIGFPAAAQAPVIHVDSQKNTLGGSTCWCDYIVLTLRCAWASPKVSLHIHCILSADSEALG